MPQKVLVLLKNIATHEQLTKGNMLKTWGCKALAPSQIDNLLSSRSC